MIRSIIFSMLSISGVAALITPIRPVRVVTLLVFLRALPALAHPVPISPALLPRLNAELLADLLVMTRLAIGLI